MIDNKLTPQTVVAAVFSLAVGLGAGLYALWPKTIEAVPAPSIADKTACNSYRPTGPYDYGRADYFTTTGRLDGWNKHLKPLAGKPIHYLEVGVFEGRSMVWMLENILTHKDSTATGVDITVHPRYMENLVRSGACEKVRNVIGPSQDVLHTLPKESFDLIYIDASHFGPHVMVDAVLAFDRLKVGGILIFDEYDWFPEWAKELTPRLAVDSFVSVYRNELELVHKDFQLILKKRANPCEFDKYRRTPVGPYCYHWVAGDLVRQSDKEPVPLLPGEREMIARIAGSARFAEIDLVIEPEMRARPEFQAMNKRLRLF